ncbi:GDSL-type esterase/lipase family protein [Butyrivibrio sp. AE3009]|uniref:GDSL-type esterase/lipase family protein n=1 Tax=Butyrivibrio sp. AE3009 TaxID=1280666 RepID=UPI0003B2E67C|nr:GDSL-type esterase/lipase family protein [Butyrivibrio sp. AE3009]
MFLKNFTICGGAADSTFTTEKGYGTWEPDMARTLKPTASEQALKSGGWNRRVFEKNECFPDREVLIIKAEVPVFGTYRVIVRITSGSDKVENLILFAGRRNLIDRGVVIEAGGSYEKEFHTAVTPYIPALSSRRCEEKAVYISLTGENLLAYDENVVSPVLRDDISVDITIEEKEVPVIWIAGDSTLTDQNAGVPYFPKDSCGGWAQMLSMFIQGAAVCNMAHSGLTSNCFRDDGHYAIVQELIKSGDLLVIQFGHNDQKRRNLSAFKGYYNNLLRYVEEADAVGAKAIICSPISRIPLTLSEGEARELDMPRHYSLLSSYAKAARKAAENSNAFFVDLHEFTFDKWVSVSDRASDFFIKGDITHTNDLGAMIIADRFIEECRKAPDCSINDYDNGRAADFSEKSFDMEEAPKEIPASDFPGIELPYVDIPKIRDCIFINEALKYGILDPCVMHLHPDDEMPRAQFLMSMFKAFRKTGVRPYHKKYADIAVDEWDSGYVQALIDENLIDDITIKRIGDKQFFRPDDALSYGEYASFLIRFMEKDKSKRNISMEECLKKAYDLDIIGDICKGNENDFDFDNDDEIISDGPDYKMAGCPYISRARAYRGLARVMDIIGGMGTALPADAEVHPAH